MKIDKIYITSNSKFSTYVAEWADQAGIITEEYDIKDPKELENIGLLLINANQDSEKELVDFYNLFDKKHIPVQKIDVNGTLQVAVSNFELWLNNFKCKNVLILGSDSLVKNDNLVRFFERIKKPRVKAS